MEEKRLIRSRKFLVVGLGISLAVSISAVYFFSAGLLCLWIWGALKHRKSREWQFSPFGVCLVAYGTWSLVSMAWAPDLSVRKSISVQLCLLMFFLVAHGLNKSEIPALGGSFLMGIVFVSALGITQSLTGINFIPYHKIYVVPEFFTGWSEKLYRYLGTINDRSIGTRSHALTYAETLMPGFLLLVSIFISGTIRKRRSIAVVLLSLVVVGGAIVLAQGRAVWISVFLAVLLMGIVQRSKVGLIFGLAVICIVGLVIFKSPTLRGRALSAVSWKAGSIQDQSSKNIRLRLWRGAFQEFNRHPIIGGGQRGLKITLDMADEGVRVWTEAHNIFLQAAAELGIVGLGLLLWIFVTMGRLLWSASIPWRTGFLACLFSFILLGLTESWIKDKEITFIFFALCGAAECLRLNGHRTFEKNI